MENVLVKENSHLHNNYMESTARLLDTVEPHLVDTQRPTPVIIVICCPTAK